MDLVCDEPGGSEAEEPAAGGFLLGWPARWAQATLPPGNAESVLACLSPPGRQIQPDLAAPGLLLLMALRSPTFQIR